MGLHKLCPLCRSGYPEIPETVAGRLEAVIAAHMRVGSIPHAHEAAKELGMSERSLARGLRNEGTGFNPVLARLRQSLCRLYLEKPDMPMGEVAWLLGFGQQTSFTHACKKWFGKTPSEMRSLSKKQPLAPIDPWPTKTYIKGEGKET